MLLLSEAYLINRLNHLANMKELLKCKGTFYVDTKYSNKRPRAKFLKMTLKWVSPFFLGDKTF